MFKPIAAAFCALLILTVSAGCADTAENIRLVNAAVDVQKVIQQELDSLDSEVASAASQLSAAGLSGPEAEQVLVTLFFNHIYLVDCCTVGTDGKIVTVVPDAYKSVAGSDISSQEQVIRLKQTGKPVLSHIFKSVEGIDAVDLQHPIFSQKGQLIGSVSAMFRPARLFDLIARPAVKDAAVEKIWAMQTDGWIIYDYDAAEIDTNLFQDPLYQPYTSLITLGRQIADRASGCGGYEFLNLGMVEPVKKQCCWTNVSLHGTDWRIMAVQVISAGK